MRFCNPRAIAAPAAKPLEIQGVPRPPAHWARRRADGRVPAPTRGQWPGPTL